MSTTKRQINTITRKRDSFQRRTTVWESLRSLGIDGEDEKLPPPKSVNNNSNNSNNTRQYARRGSVTRFQMEAPSERIQPSSICRTKSRKRVSAYPITNESSLKAKSEAPSPRIRKSKRTTPPSPSGPSSTRKRSSSCPLKRLATASKSRSVASQSRQPQRAAPPPPPPKSTTHQQQPPPSYRRRGSITRYSLANPDEIRIQPSSRSNSMKRRSVHFGKVRVYEFPVILGDNPSVRSGAPVRLGQTCTYKSRHSLDAYELCYRSAEEGASCALLPVQERAIILLEGGYNIYEIAEATLQAEAIKKQRLESLQNAGTAQEQVTLLMESASRALKRMVDTKPIVVGAKTA